MRCINTPKGSLPFLVIGTVLVMIGSTGCGSPNWSGSNRVQPTPLAASYAATTSVPVLLFNGAGTSSSDVAAVESVLSRLNLHYSTANTSQINAMSQARLAAYKLLIVPGGNSITIGKNLSHSATTRIHDAIVKNGLHYLGICAGAFFGGYSIYNGLNLTNGVWFNFYPDEFKGIHKASLMISFPNATKLDMYWQDGPQLSHWGHIISKYPDGMPAMVEGKSGNGWVILSGVHPEAPTNWRSGMNFSTSVATDQAYAGKLVSNALNGTSLPHF